MVNHIVAPLRILAENPRGRPGQDVVIAREKRKGKIHRGGGSGKGGKAEVIA